MHVGRLIANKYVKINMNVTNIFPIREVISIFIAENKL